MNKKLMYVLCLIFTLFLPFSLVHAKTVEELIKEQNPSKLGVNARMNMTCKYATNNRDDSYFGVAYDYAHEIKSINYTIKYNGDSKKNELSINKRNDSSTTYAAEDISAFLSENVYYCPETIYAVASRYVSGTVLAGGIDRDVYSTSWKFTTTKPAKDYAVFHLGEAKIGGTIVDGDSVGNYYPGLKKTEYVCGGVVSDDLLKEINKIYKTISLVVVVAVIILGILDFMKAISSDDDSALKKAASKFMKRIVIAIILVILPILLQFILSLFGDTNMKECLNKIK